MVLKKIHKVTVSALAVASLTVGGLMGYDQVFPTTYEIVGVCSTFDMNRNGLALTPGAYKTVQAVNIPLLIDHDASVGSIVGRVTEITTLEDKVIFRAQIRATNKTKAVIQKILSGELNGISIGFIPLGFDGTTRRIHSIDLLEISLVAIPADPGARVLAIRKL